MRIIINGRTFGATPAISMTPDGRFIDPPRPRMSDTILRAALVVAVSAAALAALALAFWLVVVLVPIAIGAALVAWAAWRYRQWRAGRAVAVYSHGPSKG